MRSIAMRRRNFFAALVLVSSAGFALVGSAAESVATVSVRDADTRDEMILISPRLPTPRQPLPIPRQFSPALPLGSGGSNYLWYKQTPAPECDRGPYGVVPNYADPNVRSIVQQQLAAMRIAGMARINLGLNFFHGPMQSGTLIDSSDPAVVAQMAQNLAALLADVKAAGFSQVLFRLFPAGAISPTDPNYPDPTSAQSLVGEHFNLIQAMRSALVASGVPYLIDLSVEAAPRDSELPIVSDPWKYPSNSNWSRGVRALWQRYYAAYGSADTVGFSFITDNDAEDMLSRVRHMRYVYDIGGGNPRYPGVFALDIYGPSYNGDTTSSEAVKFTQFDSAMNEEDPNGTLGWRDAGVIVAETFYNDPIAAENILSAMSDTGRRVYFLAQWPWDRGADANNSGNCTGINVPPPFAWDIYRIFGF